MGDDGAALTGRASENALVSTPKDSEADLVMQEECEKKLYFAFLVLELVFSSACLWLPITSCASEASFNFCQTKQTAHSFGSPDLSLRPGYVFVF